MVDDGKHGDGSEGAELPPEKAARAPFGFMNHPRWLFGVGMLAFLGMAILGWVKLPYGVSFMDEGLAMTDGWRLTAGDRLFPDSAINAVRMYATFNAVVFALVPDVTLLECRQLQYLLTLLASGLFAGAVYLWTRNYWYLPLSLSLFAFTGLDTAGMMSNLTYYVYPHLFITLHIALLLIGLKCTGRGVRTAVLALSGLCLWAVGFSVLPLSVTMAAPVLTWMLLRRTGWRDPGFSGRDLLVLLAPPVVLWLGFLGLHAASFAEAVGDVFASHFSQKKPVHTGVALVLKYMIPMTVFVAVFRWCARFKSGVVAFVVAGLGVLGWILVDTGGLGAVFAYRAAMFREISWFSALLAGWLLIIGGGLLYCLAGRRDYHENEPLIWLLAIPSALLAGTYGVSSGQGLLTFAYVAIPCAVGLTLSMVSWYEHHPRGIQFVAVAALLAPFYLTTARADWNITYFDGPVHGLTTTISSGFLEGIRTRRENAEMFAWIEDLAERFSEPDDFVLAYNWAPMVNVVVKRRPPMNHSWVGMGDSVLESGGWYMANAGRWPKLAFRFSPTTRRGDTGPLDSYLVKNMRLLDRFDLADGVLECFIRKDAVTGEAHDSRRG
ncbi:MAG: hypothetical protein ACE5FN_10330 [Leptospirillia bacterium]